MKTLYLWLLLLLATFSAIAQDYQFNRTMSRKVLDNYLDRSITMQGQTDLGSPDFPESERQKNITMLGDINAKFVGRIGGWWDNFGGQGNMNAFFAKVAQNTQELHNRDPEVICQGAVFEYTSSLVNTFDIPAWVFTEFNQTPATRTFNYAAMLYPGNPANYEIYGHSMSSGDQTWIIDITQPESQMWVFYMAARYIDSGCEAIHFGQTEIMSRRDVGNQAWWSLLQRVRAYARTHARRELVLCDAHVVDIGTYYEPGLNISQTNWQTYKPAFGWQKQLMWDFHSMFTGYDETGDGCTSQTVTLQLQPNRALYRRSLGGLNPQGWYCRGNAYLSELDNAGVESAAGCGYDTGKPWTTYGWDEISWFASQPELYRNQVLLYTYNKIKCLDLNGHFEMPGMRNVNFAQGQPEQWYRANSGPAPSGLTYYNQQNVIKDIWDGVYKPNSNWVKHNWSDEQVANSPEPSIAGSNLIFVGSNRMYYIGIDSHVHGYIKYGDTWLTTSPSYAANVSINGQVAASNFPGSLVANPSGTMLYYLGIDGYIYEFHIDSDWNYTYSSRPAGTVAMQQQRLRAVGPLVCTTDDRLYYVAIENGNNGERRIHGFINYYGSVVTTSPSWSAGNTRAQMQAANDLVGNILVANPSGTALYYRGADGFIYQFQIIDDWTYTYSAMPTNASMNNQGIRAIGSLACPADGRLYYTARELGNRNPQGLNTQRVHALINYWGTWVTTSPSWVAANGGPVQAQSEALPGSLSCSPDNRTIAYIGRYDLQMHGFNISNDWDYSYFNFNQALSSQRGRGGTGFNADNELFYIAGSAQYGDLKVHSYRYQPDYCGSTIVQNVDPGCCVLYRSTPTATPNVGATPSSQNATTTTAAKRAMTSEAAGVSIFPNPATDAITITSTGFIDRVVVTGTEGKVYLQHTYDPALFTAQLSVAQLPAGVYIVGVLSQGKTVNQKLIIAR